MPSQLKDVSKSRHQLSDMYNSANVELLNYKLLVENIKDYAIFLLDTQGSVKTWNKGAEKHKGYKSHEIIGRHFSTFYLQEDKDAGKPAKELELAIKYGRVEDEDWRVRKDGSKFWANVIITALFDNDKLVGFAKVTRDLTDRKFQEDELRSTNMALKRHQMELEQLNNSKDEFISLASHQLRTPATSIKQYLGMILEGFVGDLSASQKDFIQKAFESNERQIDIINNLLKVAQLDAGKVNLSKVSVDVKTMFRSIIEEYSESFRKRQQSVVLDVNRDVKDMYVDPVHFRMALENLIDNASKYTPQKGSIKLSVNNFKDAVELRIKDSGVGIDQHDLNKLFGKFVRIPNELSDTVGGTGLGLYWVKKIIELHGGTIAVTSQPGNGTEFIIRISVEHR